MSKQLQPICFFVNDRKEMINQMFSTMKEDKLRAMLPPILKGLPLAELKSSCLEELLGISSKRIKSILVGRELQSSSDSEDLELSGSEDEPVQVSAVESDSDSDNDGTPASRRPSREARSEDALQIAISSEEIEDVLEESDTPVQKTKFYSMAKGSETNRVKLKRPQSAVEAKEKPAKLKRSHKPTATNGHTEELVPSDGRTLLEIVELELRARAIRAALTHQEKILDQREVPNTGIVIEIKDETDIKSSSEPASNRVRVTANSSLPGTSKGSGKPSKKSQSNETRHGDEQHSEVGNNLAKNDDSLKNICEEISSIEDTFENSTDDGEEEPELIEPIIESIVISSDSEPEKPVEKQQASWKERWLQKRDIASVMKASKLITNVKRKMKRNKSDKIALAQVMKDQEIASTPSLETIQGTVSEFNLLTTAAVPSTSEVEQPSVEVTTLSEQPTQISQIGGPTLEESATSVKQHKMKQKKCRRRAQTPQTAGDEAGIIVEGTVSEFNQLTTMTTLPVISDTMTEQFVPDESDVEQTKKSEKIRLEANEEKATENQVAESRSLVPENSSVDTVTQSSTIEHGTDDHSPNEQLRTVCSIADESIVTQPPQEAVEAPTIASHESSQNHAVLEVEDPVMLESEGNPGSPGSSEGSTQSDPEEQTSQQDGNDDSDEGEGVEA